MKNLTSKLKKWNLSMHTFQTTMLKFTRISKNSYIPCHSKSQRFHPNRVIVTRNPQLIKTTSRKWSTKTKSAPSLKHKQNKMKSFTKWNLKYSNTKYLDPSTWKSLVSIKTNLLNLVTNIQLISSNGPFSLYYILIPMHHNSPNISNSWT